MKFKKITKAGGITIPSDIRLGINIMPGDAVDIDTQGNKVIISAHISKCFICRSEENVISFKGKDVCGQCITEMGGVLNE